jgi:integrase
MTTSSWKGLFAEANQRCERHRLPIRAHAHMLRHSFAVITLEPLQRGHIANLSSLNLAQRQHHTRVFGDPVDWVRRRLGHRSVTTTHIYFHCLAELEMVTRTALVPEVWEDLRDALLSRIAS